jgi:steroid 5-alpha reductase family enzyme
MLFEVLRVLAINIAMVTVVFLSLWALCLRWRDVTVVDAYWGLGMGILALSTFLQMAEPTPRRWLLLGLCLLWSLRLGGYLLWRWRDHGPDRRYVRMMEKAQQQRGWGFAKASLLLVFVTQAPMQFIVALPVQLGQIAAEPLALGTLAYLGAALAIFGIIFESVGDYQLTRFRKNPANEGQVLSTGLWSWTRHPNYFGDACVWWGLFLIAAESSLAWWAIVGPLLLTWTLMKWSGAPTLEYRMRKTKPGYQDYIARTSGFFPLPPKRG